MEILSVIHRPQRRVFLAAQEVDDKLILLKFPEDTLEWRAAEYQIEPTEVDLLMDIVLYEQFAEKDPLKQSVLWTASSIEEAREQHIAKIMSVKQEHRPNGPRKWKARAERISRLTQAGVDAEWLDAVADDDALRPIRDGHVMEVPVLIEKMRLVAQLRERSRRQGAYAVIPGVAAPGPAVDRAARIRTMRMLGEANNG